MKTTKLTHIIVILYLFPLSMSRVLAAPLATAFTYQGRLVAGTIAANGNYDFKFDLFDASSRGNQIAGSLTNNGVSISNGLFVALLDFGPSVFSGTNYWLQLGIKTNGGGGFTILAPRQELTPSPYAIYAATANASGISGTLPPLGLGGTYSNAVNFNNGANQFTGDGSHLAGVNAATLGGIGAGAFWQLSGNAGTTAGVNFVGTKDNQPLELKVNSKRALRLEPTTNSPNLIGGFSGNYVTNSVGATIGGGGSGGQSNLINAANYAVIAGGSSNTLTADYYGRTADYATIGGGLANYAMQRYSTIGGGLNNQAVYSQPTYIGDGATIGGGNANYILAADYSTIAGGQSNNILGSCGGATIGGGVNNFNQGFFGTIGGGSGNLISGTCDLGYGNDSSTIGGGGNNLIGFNGRYSTIAGGWSNSIIYSSFSFGGTVGGGLSNTVTSAYGTIPGGIQAKVSNFGQQAYASGAFAASGDAQTSIYVCRGITTNATQTPLFLDGVAQQMRVPLNTTWCFDIIVTGRASDGTSAAYQLLGEIKNDGGVTTLGSPVKQTIIAEDNAAWDATAARDNVNDALVVKVTGSAGVTVRWVANVRTVDVSY